MNRKSRIKFLSKDEVERVVACARSLKEKALMETLFSTGLRVHECVAIQREALGCADGPNMYFSFSDGSDPLELSIIGKGGWQRVVFFSARALVAIRDYLRERGDDPDPRLFPMTTRTAERIVKRCALAANVHATPHTFRHSLATHLLKQGANIRVVQEMLGHRSLSSTMIYTGVTNRDLLEAHRKLV